MTRYFHMKDDLYVPGRWYLSDPTDAQGGALDGVFGQGERVHVAHPVGLHLARAGSAVDYSELAGERVPVVHVRVATVLTEVAPSDVQIIPVRIEGQPDCFCIVNVIRVVRCIDEGRSAYIGHYTAADADTFPDRIGEYKAVEGMKIDPTKPGDIKIFRPWGWYVPVIVSEDVKDALERIGTVGVKFTEV
jgi:Immunity protein family (Imm11)